MADLPENYVTLLQLRERWLKRKQEAEESVALDAREPTERCEANDRKRATDGRETGSLSGKGREKEARRARDIADRRRSYYWCRNKDDGGDESRGRRGMALSIAEDSGREPRSSERSEYEVRCCAATSKDGSKLPHAKEIVESSCFASAVVEDTNEKAVKRGGCQPESSNRRRRSFERLDSGPARAKEDDAGGSCPRPFGRNDAGGSPRELTAFAEESRSLERPSTRRSDPEVRQEAHKSTIPPVDSGGIIRIAIVKDSDGKEARSEVFQNKSGNSEEKSHGKIKKDKGMVGAKEGQGGGNWQHRPLKSSKDADIGDDRRQRGVVASVAEFGALKQHIPRRSDSGVVLVDGMPTTVPRAAFHKKSDNSKWKKHRKYKKHAGEVGLEEGQGEGNWQGRRLQRNEDSGIGDSINRREVIASVAAIVAVGSHLPGRSATEFTSCDHMLTSVPYVLESPPSKKELVPSVCFTGTVVEESSAKEEKRSNKERKKPGAVRGKDDENRLDNISENVHDVESTKEEYSGSGMNNVDYLKRSKNCLQKGFNKTKPGMVGVREEEEQVGNLADGHNMPLETDTLPGGKETERVASEGKALEVNGSGNGRRVISGPINNRFSHRRRIIVGEDNVTRKEITGDKEPINQEGKPVSNYIRAEGKLGKQKNFISSKVMVFHSDEGEVMRRLRGFSIGSSRQRGGQERRSPPRTENSRSWSIGRKDGGSSSYMYRDMVWVKKGDTLRGNKKDHVAHAY